MEINRIDVDKPKEIVWSSNSDGYELGQTANRSFICTFCKRGFSNAQALGGHMNVHRKDRARQRESLNETEDHNLPASPDEHHHNSLLQPELNDDNDQNCSHKRSWILSNEDEESPKRKDGLKEVVQLPLFVETISSSTNTLETSSGTVYGHEEKKQPSPSSEVDLELRLGLEPKEDS